jgi:phospholipase C
LDLPTFPEVLEAAGVSWKIYQDLAGPPGPPFFGDGEGFGNAFTGNFADGTLLYFNQYGTAAQDHRFSRMPPQARIY